jgi:GNAT superfamily N-acetyltransferase
MPDMLVKLYTLPPLQPYLDATSSQGITIRRPIAPEKQVVITWVRNHFNAGWVSEAEGCFSNMPVSCYVAIGNETVIGFSCYETTRKNFFGPLGVAPEEQGKGIGKTLLLQALYAMRELGYSYSIIGFTGVPGFYEKFLNALPIPGSEKSFFEGILT